MSLQFAWPWMFLALPLPLLAAWLLPRAPAVSGPALRIPFFHMLEGRVVGPRQQRSPVRLWVASLAWLALVSAAARPQWVGAPLELPVTGRDLMLAVDISGSMATEDMLLQGQSMDRLTAVKMVAGAFIERREGDRIGLILFGSRAYLQAPLTFDRETVRTLLDEAAIGLAGKQTAIGDAIGLAVKRLREEPEKNRVLILLTDGANTAGAVDPLKAADLAAQEKVRIYTIGVGADTQIVQGLFGRHRIANSDLDEATLKSIAAKTGGQYFRARDLKGLERIYQALDALEPAAQAHETFRPVKELYRWPLAAALLIAAGLMLASAGWPRRREARHA